MTEQYCINELFPTRVIYKDCPELITDTVIAKSKKILEQYQDQPYYSPCNSTVKTFSKVLDIDELVDIKKCVSDAVSVFINVHKINPNGLDFLDSWLNYYDVGGYQDLHMHHDSMISGVIYLESLGQKDFVFQAPWHFQQARLPNYQAQTIDNSHNVEYNSPAGRVIIFMSHALHRTLPAQSPRMSISFNVG